MQLTLKELTDKLKDLLLTHAKLKDVNVCTYDDLLIKVSENKNEYFGAFIVYDLRQIQLLEWSTVIPLTIIFADKLRPNRENEIFIHSDTVSIAVDSVKMIRDYCRDNGLDGLDQVTLDIWSEDESDSRLAGSKIDFLMNLNIGGYCDVPLNS
jgi:hypothetical protein